ncbi:MAG: PAS domain S-box protein [Verrucomicrobiales bacterium]|nr:PAS domain S-box protein [Verrucomicrobiales bacterium]
MKYVTRGALTLALMLGTVAYAANPASEAGNGGSPAMPWPMVTGALAVAMVFLLAWMQARHRRRVEQSNEDLRRSEAEARRAFDALRESQQLLASITDNICEAVYRSSPEHGLIFVNRAYLRMFGYASQAELSQVPREKLYANPADRERLLGLVAREGGFSNEEFEYRRKDGSTFWALSSSTGIFDEKTGQLIYHVGTITDITERKKAQDEIQRLNQSLESRILERTAELRASEERMRTLVEHAPEAIVVFDADSRLFVDCNENAIRFFGLSRDELYRLGPIDVSPTAQADGRSSLDTAPEAIRRALAGDAPVFEWTHRHASGRLIPCEVRLVRLPAEGRNLVRGSIIDSTERKRREKIQQAIYQISEAVHTVEDLSSLYARIHQIIERLMAARNFYIALLGAHTETFHFAYFVDERDSAPSPMRLSTGLTGYVLRTGKAFLTCGGNVTRGERPGEAAILVDGQEEVYLERGSPAAVWLGAPMKIAGRTIGVIAVQHYQDERAYGEEEKQVLTFVAEQTALAIERKQADQALRTRSEQIRRHRNVLLELAQLDKSDWDRALLEICRQSATTLGVARVGYWSLAEDGRALVCELLFLSERNEVAPQAPGTRLRSSDCPSYFEAISTKQPIVADDARTCAATCEMRESYLEPLGITSMLDAPVWVHGNVVGVLCHEHIGPVREWAQEEIDLASSLATMVSISIEAAQRARSEKALRESEQKFRALFEASSQGVMIHDEEKFLEVNPAALRILGFSRAEEIIGKHPVDTSPPTQPSGEGSAAVAQRHITECLTNGSTRFDWISRTADGGTVPLEVILTRVEMGGRRLIQAVINDISERKKAEAELLKSLAREKELGQLKGDFVSMVSHEFRTPLGVIMSSAEILESYFDRLDPKEQRDHLQSIQKNTRRMAGLMEEVLVLSKVEAGKMDFKPAPIALPAFYRRLTDEVLAATEHKCPINLECALPPGPASADDRLLRHIFTNLLTNAVKYSPAGSQVDFGIARDGGEMLCRVRDRGIGIAEADRERLFTAFHRGRNVGNTPGTGLGLTIVRRCVELHGGTIEVESTVGEGTTMIVRLPVFAKPEPK